MKLSTWTKPGTSDTRVYFNGIGGDVKVFAAPVDLLRGEALRFEIKFSARGYASEQDPILDQIGRDLEAMNGGEPVILWDTLKGMAK